MKLPGHAGYVGESNTESDCECENYNTNLGRLKVLAEAHWNRNFRLVLCVESYGRGDWDAVRALELQVQEAHRDEELRSLLSGSSVISTKPSLGSSYI
jgi:hypothetical protein